MKNKESGELIRLDDYRKKEPDEPEKIRVSDDGYFIYPENKEPILLPEQALALAEVIISTFEQEGALLKDYAGHKISHILKSGTLEIPSEVLNRDYTNDMQKSLESTKSLSVHRSTQNIIEILSYHKEHPRNFYGTYIYPIACELRRRLKNDRAVE